MRALHYIDTDRATAGLAIIIDQYQVPPTVLYVDVTPWQAAALDDKQAWISTFNGIPVWMVELCVSFLACQLIYRTRKREGT